MKIHLVIGSVLLTLGGVFAATAQAATFESGYVLVARSEADGIVDTDTVGRPDTTASSGVTTLKGGFDTITAEAMQNRGGQSRVEVGVECGGTQGLACGGYTDETEAKATAERTSFQLLDGVPSVRGGTFDFRISGIKLGVFNGGGFGTETFFPQAKVSFLAQAFLNDGGTLLDEFSAELTLTGRYNNFQIENARQFTGSVQRQECFADTCLRGEVDVSPLSGALRFGPILFGDTLIIYTKLQVEAIFDGTEKGAYARAFDPNGTTVSSLTFDTGPAPSTVPVPASGLMLLSAIAGAAALRRRLR